MLQSQVKFKSIAGIRFNEDDYACVAKAAASLNRPLTNYIRDAAIRDAKFQLTQVL